MGKYIHADKYILDKIDNIDSRKLSEFYRLLYNMLINHFIAYRILSVGFFNEEMKETTIDKIAWKVCKAQPIIERIPILSDLVSIPFQILNMIEEKSSRLNSIIVNKINDSKLQSEAIITLYISHLVGTLMNSKSFNNKLMKAILEEEPLFLSKIMDVFG